MHALETEQGWQDYGRANRNCPNKAEAFTTGWANLHSQHPEYDHQDRERFLRIFMEASNTEADMGNGHICKTGMFGVCRECGKAIE